MIPILLVPSVILGAAQAGFWVLVRAQLWLNSQPLWMQAVMTATAVLILIARRQAARQRT